MKTRKKLGEMLLEAGVIDDFQLRAALTYQSEWGGRLGSVLVRKGFLSERELLSAIVEQYGIKSISLDAIERPTEEVLSLVKADIAKKFCIFPLEYDGKTLLAAMADPTDLKTIDDISFMLGTRIKPVLALESEIMRAIGRHYKGAGAGDAGRTAWQGSASADRVRDRTAEAPHQSINTVQEKIPVAEYSGRQAIEGLIDLLIDKGIITKEELIRKMVLKGTPQIRIGD